MQKPEQRAILVSGFAQTERVREAMRLGIKGYLKKPFKPLAAMARVVAEALARVTVFTRRLNMCLLLWGKNFSL